jgi:predicted alpha/beta hydrolase
MGDDSPVTDDSRHATSPADVAVAATEGRSWTVPAGDDHPLGARVFEPASVEVAEKGGGTVIVFPATAVPQRFYRHFAAFLAGRGLRVVTFDYRGMGESRPPSLRGFEATMSDWALLDAAAVIAAVEAAHPGPWAGVGHSFGGQMLGLVDELRHARGMLLVASQIGWQGNWRGWGLLRVGLFWHLMIPLVAPLAGYLPAWTGFGEDVPAGVALEWRRWALDPDYLAGERHHPDGLDRFAAFDRPVLAYSFDDDWMAPRRAVDHLHRLLSSARLEHRRLSPRRVGRRHVGHFGFFRPGGEEALWQPAAAFLEGCLESRLDGPSPDRAAARQL